MVELPDRIDEMIHVTGREPRRHKTPHLPLDFPIRQRPLQAAACMQHLCAQQPSVRRLDANSRGPDRKRGIGLRAHARAKLDHRVTHDDGARKFASARPSQQENRSDTVLNADLRITFIGDITVRTCKQQRMSGHRDSRNIGGGKRVTLAEIEAGTITACSTMPHG